MLKTKKKRPSGFHALTFDVLGIPKTPMLLNDGHVCTMEFLTTEESDLAEPVVITVRVSGNAVATTEELLVEGHVWCVTNRTGKTLMVSFHP